MNDTVANPETKTVTKVKRPQMYNVVFLNDDFTPMDFVVEVLQTIFFKNVEESAAIMLEVHHYARGIAGIYTREIAEAKVQDTSTLAAHHRHPLKVISEPAGDDNSGSDD